MVAQHRFLLLFVTWLGLSLVSCGGIGWDSQGDITAPDDDADDDGGDDDGGDDDADDDGSDDDTWGDDDSGDPDAQAPPTLDPYPEYTNDPQVVLTGTAEIPGSTITVYGSGTYTTLADGVSGDFSLPVALLSGINHFDVTATDSSLESGATHAAIERCDPGDNYESPGNDSCATAHDLGSIPDSGFSVEVTGNLVPTGDEDWFTFVASDDLAADQFAAEDHWEPKVDFTRNDDDFFVIEVFRDTCQNLDCPELSGGYTAYSYNYGLGPCDPPDDFCVDHTTPLWIHVLPAGPGEARCRAYTLQISNGM